MNPRSSVAHRYGALAGDISAALATPKIRAFHLPPKRPPGVKQCEFCALELDDGSIGLTYVSLGDTVAVMQDLVNPADLAGRPALAVAEGYARDDAVSRALGFAAINALSQALFAKAGWQPDEAADSLGELKPQAGERIGMVGLFPPLVPSITAARADLTVLEMRADLAGRRDGFRVTLNPAEMADREKVVSTCTIMLNHTVDAVLAACRGARYLAIVGPTAGCIPDPLFDHGVKALGGRRITDGAGFRDALLAGGKWGEFACKYSIFADSYPGVDSLLRRVAAKT